MALIVGNLDCESDFAALALGRGRRTLPQRVLRKISDAATLLRVIAEPGDRLWTPLPADLERIPLLPASEVPGTSSSEMSASEVPGTSSSEASVREVPGTSLREVPVREVPATSSGEVSDGQAFATSSSTHGLSFCSGLLQPERGEGIIAWGRTARIAELEEQASSPAPRDSARPTVRSAPVRSAAAPSLRERLLGVTPVAPKVVAQVNHRALALQTARDLGCALPGATRIASLDDLRLHLRSGGAAAGAGNAWVVKAPWSAAGRLRYIASPSTDPSAALEGSEVRAHIDRLLKAQGELLFEPWMDRVDDWGCSLWIGREAVEVFAPHRLLVDRRGRFQGIASGGDADGPTGPPLGVDRWPEGEAVGDPQSAPNPVQLSPTECDTLLAVAREVAEVLRSQGYRGPAGIDAWRYRSDQGVRLNPLGEINARLTFGWVWRASWEDRTSAADSSADGCRS